MKIVKTTLKTLAALAFALSPTIALAHPNRAASPHVRPNLFHDRGEQLSRSQRVRPPLIRQRGCPHDNRRLTAVVVGVIPRLRRVHQARARVELKLPGRSQ